MVARLHLATQATVCLLGMAALFRAEVQGQVVQDVIAPLDSLSARQLAAELHRLEAILPEAPRALATTLGPRAATLLSAADLPAAERLLLVKTLAPQLDDQARSAALSALQVSAQRPAIDFAALRSAVEAIVALGGDRTKTAALVSRWLPSQELSRLPLDQLGWLAGQLTAPAVNPNAFAVRWQGWVTAPSDGVYRFSIPPVQASPVQTSSRYARQSVLVQLDEKTVLRSTSEQWQPVGEPVELAAGQAVRLAVDFSYTNVARDRQRHPPVMALYWTGPGVPQQLVSSSALSPDGGGTEERGLSATYRSEGAGSAAQIDPRLAFVWTGGQSIGTRSADATGALMDHLWRRATSADVLTAASAEDHPLLTSPYVMAEMLPPDQQLAWLDLLKQQPALLKRLPLRQMIGVYAAYRFHAPDRALEAVGSWLRQQPHVESTFSFRFGRENYVPYQVLADMVARQLPAHAQLLQDAYLLVDGGGCCLPAAYTMALVHVAQEDWPAWRQFLDAKLEDASLPAAARTGWLLARAMAEEVRHTHSNPYQRLSVFPLRGERFLRQALKLADSGDLKQRLYHELIARYASERDFEQAERLIQEAAEVSAATAVASWRAEVDRLRQAVRLDQQLQVLQRQASRRRIYQRYLDKAREQADEGAIQQYEQLLDALD